MPLIPYADTAALPEKAKEAFDRLPRKLNIFRMWANAPACFVSGLRFGGNILARQKLGADLRELVILTVARVEGGTYEWVQHVPIAEAAGCRKDQIAALEAGRFDDAGSKRVPIDVIASSSCDDLSAVAVWRRQSSSSFVALDCFAGARNDDVGRGRARRSAAIIPIPPACRHA